MIYPGMGTADRIVPKNICNKLALEHLFLVPWRRDKQRQLIYDEHTLCNTHDWDRFFFSFGVFDGLPEDGWLIRSGCWEIGRNFYYRKLRGITERQAEQNPRKIVWRFGNFGDVGLLADQLSQWLKWRAMHSEPFDWKDLFYRDQRLGGWLSAIEQSLDMAVDGRSIQPANCSAIFDLLLSAEENVRRTGALHKEIIQLSRTGLDQFPVNPALDRIGVKHIQRAREWIATIVGESRNLIRA